MALGLVKLPAVTLPVWAMAVSAGLSLGGTVAATYVLFRLGRSFSIMPEARALVTTGPYRHIRHPLYLADFVASLGVMLQFAQPWAAALTAANLALQLWRMRYEERVLSRAFPDYAAYAARTWRLVPGLY
jgi:protein-S-isoprenylcysteine O-methyltransferase Ste14